MELVLVHQTDTQINVTCDGQPSHTFDLRPLHLKNEKELLDDPIAYGKQLYEALFPPSTLAQRALATKLGATAGHLLLVTKDNDLDGIPWEYTYGPGGFIVLECHFVRGLLADQRIDSPVLDSGLHIVAVPSNPLTTQVEPLNIDGEWMRLKEIIQDMPYTITLERTRPPTIEQVRNQVANQRNRILHFMGHGGQHESGAILYFEKDNGDLDPVTAKQFALRVRGTVFLVTLNACVSASPGKTALSNLAATLVGQKIPYALGMRFSIPDDDARAFSRTFYSDLASGTSVEEALLQARLTLSNDPHPWVIGIPVLYTALKRPLAGFPCIAGTPTIKEHQPHIEASALPRAEGVFQGRIDELKQLGGYLTGDHRPRLVTIHGSGGQGKTALAREAVERFAYAWPGGVWAVSLENLPSREVFVNDLAGFLGSNTKEVIDPSEIERQVLTRLSQRRTLIVLDNAETLVEAVEANNEAALHLLQFIREQLSSPLVSLLVTSRSYLGWSGEVTLRHDLEGLALEEGARLFKQYAPQRTGDIDLALAEELSQKVEGHPFGLLLLAGAFNASTISLPAFIEQCEVQLLKAENKHIGAEHRQRTLYASIETSVRFLDADLRALLSGLWIFHSPFLPKTAVAIFDPKNDDAEDEYSPIYDQLHMLWRRSLLVREIVTVMDGTILLYHLLSTIRPYMEQYLEQANEREALLLRFGSVYARLASFLYNEIYSSNTKGIVIAQRTRGDLERGVSYVTGMEQGSYLLYCGWIIQRLGDPVHGAQLTERALAIVQGQDGHLEAWAFYNLARGYQIVGQFQRALELYEQALSIALDVGDRVVEGVTLVNMAGVYQAMGQPQQALEVYEQALPILRGVGDPIGEAGALVNMAALYVETGQGQRALELYEQALPIIIQAGDLQLIATIGHNLATMLYSRGDWQGAAERYQETLSIQREIGDPIGETSTLSSLAAVYYAVGQHRSALELYKQAVEIAIKVGDPALFAATLHKMAAMYHDMGYWQLALESYEQILSIQREVGDRIGEARTLGSMAKLYRDTEQPRRALELYEQVLFIQREVNNRVGEATTLSTIAEMYKNIGQLQRALELYEQALPIQSEVGDRTGEARTLTTMAEMYYTTGQLQRALMLLEQALPIQREVGDQIDEVNTLSNLALMCQTTGQPQRALDLYEQALLTERETGNRAGEAATLARISAILYEHLNRPQEAITQLEQAITILVETGLPRDSAGQTVNELRLALETMRRGVPLAEVTVSPATLPATVIQKIITNTISVMTVEKDRRDEWRKVIVTGLQESQQQGADWQMESDFFAAVLAILDGQLPTLPTEHPYIYTVAAIQSGIAASRPQIVATVDEIQQVVGDFVDAEDWNAMLQVMETQHALLFLPEAETLFEQTIAYTQKTGDQQVVQKLEQRLAVLRACKADIGAAFGLFATAQQEPLPFDAKLISKSIAALLGGPQEKIEHVQYLTMQSTQSTDEELKALIAVIQLALFGSELSQLGQNLSGVYQTAWKAIVVGVETGRY